MLPWAYVLYLADERAARLASGLMDLGLTCSVSELRSASNLPPRVHSSPSIRFVTNPYTISFDDGPSGPSGILKSSLPAQIRMKGAPHISSSMLAVPTCPDMSRHVPTRLCMLAQPFNVSGHGLGFRVSGFAFRVSLPGPGFKCLL